MRTGFIVKLVLAMLLLVALMPKSCAASLADWVPVGVRLGTAQVMLPHRHAIGEASAGAPPFSNVDCGTPPVSSNLIMWLCAASLQTSPGYTNNEAFTNWTDISPAGTNGVYYTNVDSFASRTPPVFRTNQLNGKPDVVIGSPTLATPMTSSNAWWTGLSEVEIFWVIGYPVGLANDNWDWITSDAATGYGRLVENTSKRLWSAFGSSAYKDCGFDSVFRNGGYELLDIYSAANDWAIYTNGLLAFSTNVNTVGFPALAKKGYLTLSAPNGAQMVADVSEVLIFSNKLQSSQRTAVNNWLKNKYGL